MSDSVNKTESNAENETENKTENNIKKKPKNKPDTIRLITEIKQGKLDNSNDKALYTEEVLQLLISEKEWNNARELINLIKEEIKQVREALPLESTVINVMLHILKVIRDEYEFILEKQGVTISEPHLFTIETVDVFDYCEHLDQLKTRLLDHLTEYKAELEASPYNIATQALEHIDADDIILTVGKSNTVEKFLKFAADERTFQVFVVDGAPSYHGHILAQNLTESNIKATLISDAAVFTVMQRVNKIIIGTHSVMADGGIKAPCGIHTIALAAKRYSVPVMVLAPMYKLTPVFVCPHERDSLNEQASPHSVLPPSLGSWVDKVKVYNPIFEYVAPDLITLLISQQGGNAPSYVYRLLSETYHREDYES